ncbi:MAG TPA: MBOAT family protein [Parvibaculum sp.]|uniref:MBOAT family O-acyltransferase n=1 Tax=Parvibaculum sp. TaxID=2024848 RepID=UPI002CF5EBA1|nr:MBOAT family protein [Parvibaculum sp.]HMM14239.1 MBOAT family protein [Parvibaculum sp.]
MLFPTLEFGIFFLIVFTISWGLRWTPDPRKYFLVGASYFFYGWWDWRFTALLFATTLINYLGGLALGSLRRPGLRKLVVGLTVAVDLGVLAFFKYYGFFLTSLDELLTALGLQRDLPFMEIILPIGISFFTFQGISYVVDVYRGHVAAERSLLDVMLFKSFFPQLVAGPIVRAADFIPQLHAPARLTREHVAVGTVLVLTGLAKKMVIANYLATDLVDPVFFDPTAAGSFDLLIAVYGYAIQIYCDFSGYSDIAIGIAALLGYRFRENFNQPYRASSLQEFWRRWHISLSTWLRDYLYIPLGGSRFGEAKTYRNLFLTMFLGGVWHGAAWNFVFWGAFHGAMLGVERWVRGRLDELVPPQADYPGLMTKLGNRLQHGIGIVWTFHLVCFAWIFFRADSFETAGAYLAGLAGSAAQSAHATPFLAGLVLLGLVFQFTPRDLGRELALGIRRLPSPLLGLLLGAGIALIWMVAPEGVAPFIYFQF